MAPRPQPYRLSWPLTPEQFESIDEMFQLLFDDIGNDAIFPTTTEGDTMYRDDERVVRLPIGAANTVLRTDGVVPEWDKVGLTTDVTGTLPTANGGTNNTGTPTAGGVAYGTGTAITVSVAGTTGQALLSGGAGAPTWGSAGQTQAQIMTRVVLGI
jgi:hypothetical protein